MTEDNYFQILKECGGQMEILDQRERTALWKQWREYYATGLHAAKGRWKLGDYEWHVFSFDHAPSLEAARALEAYQVLTAEAFFVCPEGRTWFPAVKITGGRLPDFQGSGEDLHVWGADLSWCMVFTHEETSGIGPFLSRAEWI